MISFSVYTMLLSDDCRGREGGRVGGRGREETGKGEGEAACPDLKTLSSHLRTISGSRVISFSVYTMLLSDDCRRSIKALTVITRNLYS